MTATPSSYPGELRRISYRNSHVRLLTPPHAVLREPTHPTTPPAGVLSYFDAFIDYSSPSTYVIATSDVRDVEAFVESRAKAIVNLHRVNDVRRLNKFLEAIHEKLADGGHLVVCVETLRMWQRKVRLQAPMPVAYLYMGAVFLLKRVLPKLRLTRRMYFAVTKGRNRLLSRAETMGRLYCCGFEVVHVRHVDHLTFIVARKAKAPAFDMSPSYGPIFRMRRVGAGGNPIHVYKFRTMFPYAEYLQQYVYERNRLQAGGKFHNDFRVTPWGRVLRRLWIDELPMLWNWMRGELKFVGVRPLSAHYEGLYPPELRQLRRSTRPGLIPPFYADMPRTFEEILDSERQYLDEYRTRPWRTDVKYFCKAMINILFRGARSY